jgi:hypothetical protein
VLTRALATETVVIEYAWACTAMIEDLALGRKPRPSVGYAGIRLVRHLGGRGGPGPAAPALHPIGVMPARDRRTHVAWAHRCIGAPSARPPLDRPARGVAWILCHRTGARARRASSSSMTSGAKTATQGFSGLRANQSWRVRSSATSITRESWAPARRGSRGRSSSRRQKRIPTRSRSGYCSPSQWQRRRHSRAETRPRHLAEKTL